MEANQNQSGQIVVAVKFAVKTNYININNFKIAFRKSSEKGEKVNFSIYC